MVDPFNQKYGGTCLVEVEDHFVGSFAILIHMNMHGPNICMIGLGVLIGLVKRGKKIKITPGMSVSKISTRNGSNVHGTRTATSWVILAILGASQETEFVPYGSR